MPSVTVSPKFQVVIPRTVRNQMQIAPGQRMQVITLDRRVILAPIETAQNLRGFLAGVDTTLASDGDRVFEGMADVRYVAMR